MGSADGGAIAIAASFVLAGIAALGSEPASLQGVRSLAASGLLVTLVLFIVAVLARRVVRRVR